MSEISEEIATRRRQIAIIRETLADHQAIVQRLITERAVLEGEIRGLKAVKKAP